MEHTEEEKCVIAAFKAKSERHRQSVIAAQKATPKEERERRKQALLATNAAKREARGARQERITNLVAELQTKMVNNGVSKSLSKAEKQHVHRAVNGLNLV